MSREAWKSYFIYVLPASLAMWAALIAFFMWAF